MTSFRILREIVKWEDLFPKLEDWGQELEQSSSNNLEYCNEDEFSKLNSGEP